MVITCSILLALAVVSLIFVVVIMPYFLSKQNQKAIEAIQANQEIIRDQLVSEHKLAKEKKLHGLSLQAYERVALFLERINPVNMIPRILQPGYTAAKLETILVNSIREEYEHNMSQQLYITEKAWDYVQSAKEDIIKLINTSAGKVDKKAPGSDLAKEILTKGYDNEIKSLNAVLRSLKKEMQKNF